MIVLPEDKNIMLLLPPEDAKQVLIALFSNEGDLPKMTPLANMAYTAVKSKSDRISKTKSSAGKLGGAPKNNHNAKKQAEQAETTKTSTPQKKQAKQPTVTDTVTDTVSDTVTDTKDIESGAAAPTPDKRNKFGEYGRVRLTDAEYQRMIGEYGEGVVRHYISIVDERAQQTGNKNRWKDWNLTVRRAIREKWGGEYTPEPTTQPSPQKFEMKPDTQVTQNTKPDEFLDELRAGLAYAKRGASP